MSELTITENERGFHEYGGEVTCTYGTKLRVYESSSAEGPHVWLNLTVNPDVLSNQPKGEGTAHLNEEQAKELIARLQAWIDEIPERWGTFDAKAFAEACDKDTTKEYAYHLKGAKETIEVLTDRLRNAEEVLADIKDSIGWGGLGARTYFKKWGKLPL